MRRSPAPSGATRPPIPATPPLACAQRDCTRPVGSPSSGRAHRPHAPSRPRTLLLLFLYARHSNCGRRRRRTGGVVARPSSAPPEHLSTVFTNAKAGMKGVDNAHVARYSKDTLLLLFFGRRLFAICSCRHLDCGQVAKPSHMCAYRSRQRVEILGPFCEALALIF